MPYRGAIIGLGNIALYGHVPSYLRLFREVQIVAGVDVCRPNLEAFKNLMPGAVLYTDYNRLLAERKLDFIDICTPPAYHARIIQEAAKRKIHVICEKPVTTTQAEMDAITKAVCDAGIVFLPCHQYRYSPQWQLTEELIEQGRIGRPERFEVSVQRKCANLGNAHWKPDWRTIKEESGEGIVMDHGSHLFYLARQLLGKPQSISAQLKTQTHNSNGLEDTANIIMQHEGGVTELDMTWAADKRYTSQLIIGDKGEITISEISLAWRSDGHMQAINFGVGLSKDSAHAPWYSDLIENFIRSITSKNNELHPLEEAQAVLQCALLAYESASLGQMVTF